MRPFHLTNSLGILGGNTRDLDETFELMRQHCLHLNLAKCAFGVAYGKFLGAPGIVEGY